jgi:hypothetical protein
MRKKYVTFCVGFVCYGSLFGVLMYCTETNRTFVHALYSGIFFGAAMGLFEVFINPAIRNYLTNRKK